MPTPEGDVLIPVPITMDDRVELSPMMVDGDEALRVGDENDPVLT